MHIKTAIKKVKELAKKYGSDRAYRVTRHYSNFSKPWAIYVATNCGTHTYGNTLQQAYNDMVKDLEKQA